MYLIRSSWPDSSLPDWTRARSLHGLALYRSEDGGEACAYLADEARVPGVEGNISIARLEPVLEIPGASNGNEALWHYVVTTDVMTGHEEDFNAWYNEEHLPGLAGVPGTVRAARYLVVEGEGPRYYACYDLMERSVLGSPQWLAVRGTPWSSRVRPTFVGTRRTMYRVVGTMPGLADEGAMKTSST